ncbi:hypothetical protein M231_03325 [Tremella mesenterica]|uniref:2Fe-2S ferredoxin-type domain-containing protein n=1 Tax=Tremella mesenterica TaxID=5217 RepID=A0A4Q1BND0_TREME|nr:hypothetical protein M231_03325 [Tremella mesenterica]
MSFVHTRQCLTIYPSRRNVPIHLPLSFSLQKPTHRSLHETITRSITTISSHLDLTRIWTPGITHTTSHSPSLLFQHVCSPYTSPRASYRKQSDRSRFISTKPPDRPTTITLIQSEIQNQIDYLPLPRFIPTTKALFIFSIPFPPVDWPSHLTLLSPLLTRTLKVLQPLKISVNAIYDPPSPLPSPPIPSPLPSSSNSSDSSPSSHTPASSPSHTSASSPSHTSLTPSNTIPSTYDATTTHTIAKEEIYLARLFYADGQIFTFPHFSLDTLNTTEFTQAIEYIPDLSTILGNKKTRPKVKVIKTDTVETNLADIANKNVELNREVVRVDKNLTNVSEVRKDILNTKGEIKDGKIKTYLGDMKTDKTRKKEEDIYEILVCTHGSRDCRCSDRGIPLVNSLREDIKKRGMERKVKVKEVGHVGGHKYAANAIIIPSLDMYSNLSHTHSNSLLSHILNPSSPDIIKSEIRDHWRGRYGLTEEQQIELWTASSSSSSVVSSKSHHMEQEKGKKSVRLKFRTYQGEIKEVEARLNKTLLEIGKENDLPSLEGVCGGNLECATCHLYLSPNPRPPPIPVETEEEIDMLGYAIDYKLESRLGCQIKVTEELGRWCDDGGLIGLPRY